MPYFGGAEPKRFEYWRHIRDRVLKRSGFSFSYNNCWRLFTGSFGSPVFWTFVVFGQSMFSAVILVAEGTFEW